MKNNKTIQSQTEETKFSNTAYRRLCDIPGYSKETLNKTFFYAKIKDYFGVNQSGYIRCTKQQAYNNRNLDRNTIRQNNAYIDNIGNKCKSMDDGVIVDEYGDTTVVEYADNSRPSPEEYTINKKAKDTALSLLSDEKDLAILKCLLSGVRTDDEIAKIVGLTRSSAQERRTKLQKYLNKVMSDFKDVLYSQIAKRGI